jgi:hypothetical protein
MLRDSLILGTAGHIDHAASAARSEGEARAESNEGDDAA